MKKWVCSVCGYVWEGETAPEKCPVCGVGADKFNEMKGDAKLAAEHEFGIYAKTVKENPDISAEDKKYPFYAHRWYVSPKVWVNISGGR